MAGRGSLLSTTILSGVAAGAMPFAALAADIMFKTPLATGDPPLQGGAAVDGVNAKVDGFGGSFANRAIAGTQGSVTFPLQGMYGVQLDTALGSYDSRGFAVIGGHGFWRDPARGLIGIYANYTHWNQFNGVGVGQVAAEGEYYLGRWTIQGIAGVEFGNTATQVTTSAAGTLFETIDIQTRFFDKINVGYYITDNWKAFAGHRYLGGKHALALGTEWAFQARPGVLGSLFVEARVGESDFHGVWGGLKFYFGQRDKPLMARHRQDDPVNWSPETLFSITNSFLPNIFAPAAAPCVLTEILIDGVPTFVCLPPPI